jgi:hypothetical protein
MAPSFVQRLAHGARLTPKERAPLLAEDLRRAADDLEAMCDRVAELPAPAALARAHATLREALALDAGVHLRSGDWDGASRCRARYLRSYYLSPPTINPARSRRLLAKGAFEKIGANLAIIHFRAKMVHRAALLENYDPQGGITCLGSARELETPDVEQFAEDFVTLRYQARPSEWQALVRGYIASGEPLAARSPGRWAMTRWSAPPGARTGPGPSNSSANGKRLWRAR